MRKSGGIASCIVSVSSLTQALSSIVLYFMVQLVFLVYAYCFEIVCIICPLLYCVRPPFIQLGNAEQCTCIHSSLVLLLHQLLGTISSLYMWQL